MSKVTKEQIAEWKKTYGEIYEIPFEDGKVCYLAKPNRKQTSLILAKGANNPLGGVDVLLANCWLAGDEVIKTDAGYHIGLAAKIDQIVGTKLAEVKNL